MHRRWPMALLVLLLLHVAGFAQTAAVTAMAQTTSDGELTFHASTRLVMLDALVENKQTGNVVGDLTASDFRLTEDGVPQTITYFSEDRLPLSVVFMFDLTETVRPALKPLAEGARAMLGHLKPEDEIAVMIFSSHTELLQNFTTDRTLAANAIHKASEMETKDGTFIHESMYEAVQQAMRSTTPGSRRVLIWLTDGSANFQNATTQKMIGRGAPATLHTKEEATEELLHSGVAVAALIDPTAGTHMAMFSPASLIVGARMGDIRKYAEMTGGPVLNTSKKEVAVRLAALVDEIRTRYTLGYRPATARTDGTFCRIALQLNPETVKTRGDASKLRVRTKQGYFR